VLIACSDSKRSAAGDVNWAGVAYDLKDVDWDKVNWSSVFASPTPTPVVDAPKPAATSAEKKADPAPTAAAKKQEAPAVTSAKAAEPSAVKVDSIVDSVKDVVSDLMTGVETLANKIGAKIGKNDQSNNGGIWIGTDSAWQTEWTNDGNEDAVLYCWKADGFSGMSINVNQPEISVGLKGGESVNLSFAANVPAACAPMFSSNKLALFGGCDQTWWEVTFGQYGAFDVSRNVNMQGHSISSKGSKCTSDMNTCVFKCKDESVSSCEKGTDYDLFNCGASNGGGGGYDTVMAGTGGGCSMGSSGEKIQVTFS
jgi:hypothetical protein